MKLRLSLLLTAFSSIATTSYAKTNTPKSVTTKMENFHKTQQFVNAMKQSQQSNLRRASIRKLKSNLLLHAKPTPANHRDLDQNNDYYVYDNNNNNTDDDNANANANDGYYQSNNAYGDGNGDDNADDEYGNYGFDISSYSLKYASCSTVSTFSDDLAEDEDSTTVFYKQQFVIFRLCPSDYCTNGGNGSSGDRSSSSNPFVKYFNSNSNSNDNANANGDGADGDGSGENTSSEKFGCMNNYGEYMIPLADWLDIIGAYRQEEMERYCAFCDACVGGYYNDDGENGGGDDGDDYGAAANNGNKYYNYADLDDYVEADDANANNNNNNGNDDGGDQGDGGEEGEGEGENGEGEGEGENGEGEGEGENGEGEDRKLEGNNYDCSSNTSACSGYGDICYNNDQVDWSQFFGCQKMNFNDDTILYVGAHCARDKHTIVLAAFEDEYCQSYVGDHYDLATITDDAVATDSLEEYFRSDCISCKESVSFSILLSVNVYTHTYIHAFIFHEIFLTSYFNLYQCINYIQITGSSIPRTTGRRQ
jgi:hypothetical protein